MNLSVSKNGLIQMVQIGNELIIENIHFHDIFVDVMKNSVVWVKIHHVFLRFIRRIDDSVTGM